VFIISPKKSRIKRYFDVTILFLVGYSCVASLYYVAFHRSDSVILFYWDKTVELFFVLDLVLNFLTEYTDEYTDIAVREFNLIAYKYAQGWFFIDLISVFPFDLLLTKGMITKLFRLFRMPRLLKLLDVSKFKNLIRSFSAEYTNDKVIVR